MDVSKEFENIVESAKEQEMKVLRANEEIKELKKTLSKVKKTRVVKDTEVLIRQPGKDVPHERSKDVENHREALQHIPRLSIRNGLIVAKVHHKKEDGNDTTKTAGRNNLMDAIIARNEIAATLWKEGKINVEEFRKATELPEGLIL